MACLKHVAVEQIVYASDPVQGSMYTKKSEAAKRIVEVWCTQYGQIETATVLTKKYPPATKAPKKDPLMETLNPIQELPQAVCHSFSSITHHIGV